MFVAAFQTATLVLGYVAHKQMPEVILTEASTVTITIGKMKKVVKMEDFHMSSNSA